MRTTCFAPDDLRIDDLIAKTAKVTLKDTQKVILSLRMVAELYDATMEEVLLECGFDTSKPDAEAAAACNREYARLNREGFIAGLLSDLHNGFNK